MGRRRRLDHHDIPRSSEISRWLPALVRNCARHRLSVERVALRAALGLAAHCAFLPRIPTGSANPTRRRDISPAGVRLASMSAAASAYETIISGTRRTKNGRTRASGSDRMNEGSLYGHAVERDPHPREPERPLMHHRPRTQYSPVERGLPDAVIVGPVRPVRGGDRAEIDAPSTTVIEVEQGCAREKPADRPILSRGGTPARSRPARPDPRIPGLRSPGRRR